ncbi:MAG: MarR family transcriptional regulator [Bacteroidetes bacterium]|nr:MarR family transcriptional regulator [Bacteroidota bacterium]MCL6101450.1 MarR family transcriptional regulator [Bacteroidota bacterium]
MEKGKEILSLVYEMKKKCAAIDYQLMEHLNLSQSELLFFSALDQCTGISSPELAKNMGLSASRISRVIEKLVVDGYLDRNVDKTDRRAITLCLTENGKKIRAEIDKSRQECEARLLNVLPESDIEKFREIIGKMIKEM